jgi:predicted nucleic acid-binding protein
MAGTKYTVFGSRILDKELAANPKEKQRAESQALYNKAVSARAEYVRSVFNQYLHLALSVGIRNEDALHLCYAIAAGVDYLLTTDGKFLKRAARMMLPIKVINPLDFGGAI